MPESAKPNSSCADLPPELAQHPKYRILRELGRGGMGVVYQARQTGMMDRQVVIKVINRSLIDNPEVLARFRREVQAASQLSHPNIVTAYDAEMVGDLHLLVMEFVPGQNLADVLATKGPLPIASACNYVRQAARALQHAQERGMVHSDIKPENLMLTPEGQIKVLDFGIAKVVSEQNAGTGLTASNSYVGTPEYSAPEQATDARSADIRADLYSLGCTLYCLLAGRPPFREATAMKTLLAHLQKEPQPLPQLRPDVPEELWRVVARLLAKEPGQRYQKPIEVGQALTPFIKSGAKPEAKSSSTPVVGSPEKGTVIAADTRPIKNSLREVPGKTPPQAVPVKNALSRLNDLSGSPAPSRKAQGIREATHREPALRYWRWPVLAGMGVLLGPVLAGVGVLLVLLGMWAGSVFKAETKPRPSGGSSKPEDPQERGKGDTIEIPLTEALKMKFAWVPPGKSWLGGGGGKPGTHEFTLTKGLWCGVYPVTQAEWQAVMGNNPSNFAGNPRHPVESVSWDDAQAFLQKLNSRLADSRLMYRLPSEEEWEYICRGGPISQTQSAYHFYLARSKSDLTPVPTNDLSSRQANFDGNYPAGSASKGPYLQATCEVGLYLPNPLGIYDLHGNVWEWTSTPEGSSRVIRGGGWRYGAGFCSASYRLWREPGNRNDYLGFRVLATPSGGK